MRDKVQTLSKGQTSPSSIVFSSCVLFAALKCLWKGLAVHTKEAMDCKLVIGLMNADEQSLKELQKLLTWLSEGPNS